MSPQTVSQTVPPPDSPLLAPSERGSAALVSLNQGRASKPIPNKQTPSQHGAKLDPDKAATKPSTTLIQPHDRPTNPLIWCAAILCLIFCVIIIFFGVATLIIFLSVRPRNPTFDIPNANLSTIYFDSPEYFNGDFIFLANFSNPNRKINVRFEYLDIELYFYGRLIATQALQPFSQRRRETRLQMVHMISSLVYLPQNHAVELRKQVLSNRISYNISGKFKVRAGFGLLHYSYSLHARCQLEMTGPPTGALVSHKCRTSR